MTKRDNCQEDGFGLLVIKRNKNKYQSDTDWYVIYIPLDKENREGTWPVGWNGATFPSAPPSILQMLLIPGSTNLI